MWVFNLSFRIFRRGTVPGPSTSCSHNSPKVVACDIHLPMGNDWGDWAKLALQMVGVLECLKCSGAWNSTCYWCFGMFEVFRSLKQHMLGTKPRTRHRRLPLNSLPTMYRISSMAARNRSLLCTANAEYFINLCAISDVGVLKLKDLGGFPHFHIMM